VDNVRHVRRIELDGPASEWVLTFEAEPTSVEFNALNDVPAPNAEFYVWGNVIDDFHDTLIVYGTARQDEANHTLARRWQETLANAYLEILPPLVKDSELTTAQAASHDLIVLGTLDDNRLFASAAGKLPIRFGKNHFEWRGAKYTAPDDGLFLVLPNPFNPKRVMYVVAANSALQLHEMTKRYTADIASWAVFKGGKIVHQGYHQPSEFLFARPFGPS
jgi:hypothetical protein